MSSVIKTIHVFRTEILSRRRERQQRRQELTKRKSAAAQERMRILSMLAKSGSSGPGKKKEDTFGMRDEDWDIYKAVSKVRVLVNSTTYTKDSLTILD